MAVSCNINDLLKEAKCFDCIAGHKIDSVSIYLLRHIAELDDMTPQELLKESACFDCIPPGASRAVIAYLLCQILNALD